MSEGRPDEAAAGKETSDLKDALLIILQGRPAEPEAGWNSFSSKGLLTRLTDDELLQIARRFGYYKRGRRPLREKQERRDCAYIRQGYLLRSSGTHRGLSSSCSRNKPGTETRRSIRGQCAEIFPGMGMLATE